MNQGVLDERLRREQTDLNIAFVELLTLLYRTLQPRPPVLLGLRAELIDRLVRMRHRKRSDIAACPYALYSLRLNDLRFWGAVRARHVPPDYRTQAAISDRELIRRTRSFAHTALLHAWSLALNNEYAARLSLGISAINAQTLARLPVIALPAVADEAHGLLNARLSTDRRFWPDLIRAVDKGTRQQRFAAKSLGLQLLAASAARNPSHDPPSTECPRGSGNLPR